jgi:hypothetical protein
MPTDTNSAKANAGHSSLLFDLMGEAPRNVSGIMRQQHWRSLLTTRDSGEV